MDLSPPGLDEVMALTLAMEFMAEDKYHVFILDAAPTGHLIRLLETPELIDQWLKVFFDLFLKYKRIFRLPKISGRMVKISKDLKRLQALLKDPARSALFTVTIPTQMAFEETKDLIDACGRIGIHTPVLFPQPCHAGQQMPICAPPFFAERRMVKKKLQQTFSEMHQTLIYHRGEPRGP